MKYFTIILIMLFALNSYPQAELDLILTFITDEQQNNTWILHFGLDPTATNGIDPWLEETTYPPDGCGGWGFTSCIAFWFPPPLFNQDIGPRDYRYGILPYSGQVIHRLGILLGENATQAELFWDFPEGVSVHLQDLEGGVIFELDLQGTGSFVITDTILNINDRFRMIAIYDDVVPIELTSFNATVLKNEQAVRLNWSTATETNSSGFEILRFAQNDNEWRTIGFAPGFGTTTEPKSYSFTDENVSTGTYKYRLKQIDFDGSFEYSNEIEVVVDFTPREFVLYQNYPNPFNPNTVIKFEIPSVIASGAKQSQFVTLKVYDVLGNEVTTLVNEEKQAGVYEIEFYVGQDSSPDIASGIYFYQLKAGSFVETKKMILLR